jgi:hypothetical protein
VNDVRADLFDANTVYLVLDNHKEGDFKPYLLKSTDLGRSWTSISASLPQRLLTWRIVQDHVKKGLLFAATEFGVYMTQNGGETWTELKGGLPTIAFRDITIQRDEHDLVAASFGRGIFILDDISPLREFSITNPSDESVFYPVAPADLYIQRDAPESQGDTQFLGENPPFGAVFTYFLPEKYKSLEEVRGDKEKEVKKTSADVPFPGWDSLANESNQVVPRVRLTIKDMQGNLVNIVEGSKNKGFNRASWGLTYSAREGIPLKAPEGEENDWNVRTYYVTPGTYTATLELWEAGTPSPLAEPRSFEVRYMDKGVLTPQSQEAIAQFRDRFQDYQQDLMAVNTALNKSLERVDAMKRALDQATKPTTGLYSQIHQARTQILEIKRIMDGNPAKNEIGEDNPPSPGDAVSIGSRALSNTYGPTPNHKKALTRAEQQLNGLEERLVGLTQNLQSLEASLQAAGAPWIEGQGLRVD